MNSIPSSDTINLLKECNSGVKTAVSSMNEVLGHVKNEKLRSILEQSIKDHKVIGNATHKQLNQFHESAKNPSSMAKAMSWAKINTKLLTNNSDATIADLITDGCNMGIKSVCQYENQYQMAEPVATQYANQLIAIEEQLSNELRPYL